MFESGLDQAFGLRRMFAAPPLLLGLGCARGDAADQAGVAGLARALQRAGRRPVLIDLLGERGRRIANAGDLVALAQRLRGEGRRRGAEPDLALVMADPLRLADVAAALNDRIVLFAPGDASSLAQLYAQVKAVRLAHGVTRYVAAFRDARSRQVALDAHRRLADTAARFLGAAVEFGGLIPALDRDPRAWDRFAADAIGWACPLHGVRMPAAG